MQALCIWNENAAAFVSGHEEFSRIVLNPVQTGFALKADDKTLYVQPGEAGTFAGCAWRCLHIAGSIRHLTDSWTLRRTLLSSLGFDSRQICAVSAEHFRIDLCHDGFVMQDLSTNGTFVNGRRLPKRDSAELHEMDWILAAGFVFVLLPGNLLYCPEAIFEQSLNEITQWKPQDNLSDYCPAAKPASFEKLKPRFDPFPVCELEIEPPALLPSQQPPHWFSSIGSSGMILVSSLVSAVSLWIRNPQDSSAVAASLATSLSMAGAFLGFGFINRSISIHQADKARKQAEALYETYLKERREEALHHQNFARQSWRQVHAGLYRLSKTYLGCMDENWFLPVGVKQQKTVQLKLPPVRYDQKEDQLIRSMEELGRMPLQSEVWDCLKQGDVCRVSGYTPDTPKKIFGLFAWMNKSQQRKFAWIGPNLIDHTDLIDRPDVIDRADVIDGADPIREASLKNRESVFQLPMHPSFVIRDHACRYETISDWRSDYESNPDTEWLIWTQKDEAVPSLPRTTWIGPCLKEARILHLLNPLPELSDEKLRASILPVKPARSVWSMLSSPDAAADDFRSSQVSMSVQLDEQTRWDLKQDGPHALVCGMTGSGKSEGLTCVLLQLALNNDAKLLQYILIDFKGGAFAQAFYRFPHLAGRITNLQENAFFRLQSALAKELKRRQQALADFLLEFPYESADLESYNQHHPEMPLSHLLIVVDEFAQLKSSLPEAMKQLQETARIGRSLGIHLILATQKPAGVVDEQIWSNARSKLCFMVAQASDSREVLGHDKASRLRKPGAFILQVSGSSERQGQMMYVRSPCRNGGRLQVLDEQEHLLYENQAPKSILERASSLIEQDHQPNRWILHPDLLHSPYHNHGVLLDELDHLKEWKPAAGQPVWIQAPREVLEKAAQTLAASSCDPVYTVGFDAKHADQQIEAQNLWQWQNKKDCLLLIWCSGIRSDLLELVLGNPALCVVLLHDGPLTRCTGLLERCLWRFGAGISQREDQFLLFGKGQTGEQKWPLMQLWHQGLLQEAGFNEHPMMQRQTRKPIRLISNPLSFCEDLELPFGLLGFDIHTYQPVFFRHTERILIVWAQPSAGLLAKNLVRFWQMQDPLFSCGQFPCDKQVALLSLPEQNALLNTPEGIQDLYERRIFFIGKGIRDYQYALKVSAMMEEGGDGVYFDQTVRFVHTACFT